MVYIIPSKRASHTRMKYFSKYSDCDKTDLFALQKVKSSNSRRPPYRIVTRGSSTYYEVAYSHDLNAMKEREWKYIKEEMPKHMPSGLTEKACLAWIISHFTCLAMEIDGAREFVRGEDFANIDRDTYDRDDDDAAEEAPGQPSQRSQEEIPPPPMSTSVATSTVCNPQTTTAVANAVQAAIAAAESRALSAQKQSVASTAMDPNALVSTSTWPLRGFVCFILGLACTNMPMLMLREASSHTFLATMLVFNLLLFGFVVFGRPATIGVSILQPVNRLKHVISMSTLRALASSSKKTSRIDNAATSTEATDSSTKPSQTVEADDSDSENSDKEASSKLEGTNGYNAGDPIDVTPEGIVPGRTLRVSSSSPEPNSYSDPQGESWSVRCGPNYKKNKKKEFSRRALFNLHGLDVFLSETKIPHAFKHMNQDLVRKLTPVPYVNLGGEIDEKCAAAAENYKKNPSPFPTSSPEDANLNFSKPPVSPVHPDAPNFHLGTLEKPFIFVINMQIPTTAPSMMGGSTDGPTLTLLWYLIATEETQRDLMRPVPLNPAVRLVKKLAEADPKSKEGADMLYRMKALPRLVNENEFSFNYFISSTIRQYNAKPFLTRPQHSVFRGPGYLEYDLDIHGFCFTARKVLNGFIPLMENVVLDWGFTLEAYDDDEMPEVILGSMRVFKIKPSNFPSWEATIKALQKEKDAPKVETAIESKESRDTDRHEAALSSPVKPSA